MKRMLLVVALLLLAGTSSAQVSMIPKGGSGGAPSSTITSGTTDTSGCVAGGVLRSISNLVDCGAGFTASSGVVGVGTASATSGAIRIFNSGHAFYTEMTIGVQAGNISYTLPVDDGDADQVLSTNGSGVLDWVTPAAGSVTTAALEDATYCGASAVGTDSYACTLTTAPASLAAMEGVVVSFKADVANTGAATIAFNGFAATAITFGNTALVTGDIDIGDIVTVAYNGADFECLSCSGNIPNLAASNTYSTSATQTLYAANFFNPVTAITTTTTTTLAASNETFTNTGDADGTTITLLNNPTVGAMWRFAVTVAQTMTIVASAGETLMHGASTCGTSLTSNTIGSTIVIQAVVGGSGGVFMTWGATGTWVCNA